MAALGLGDKVQFEGFVDDVPDRIAACDLVLCPSVEREVVALDTGDVAVVWKEGFCLAAAEGMRAERAVIASDFTRHDMSWCRARAGFQP